MNRIPEASRLRADCPTISCFICVLVSILDLPFLKTVVAKHQMLCSKKTSQPIRKIEAINRPRILFIFLPNILFTIKEFLEYENLSIQLPRKYPQPLIHRQSIIFVPHRISSCSTFRFSINITLLIFNKHILAANPRVQTSLIVYFFAYRYT